MWIVRRHEIDYLVSATLDERIVEETWIRSMRGARSERCARFTRQRDGVVLLQSLTQWAFVDTRSQRPRRILPEVMAAFTPVENP
jgi:acyl-CoA thioester hydrolase